MRHASAPGSGNTFVAFAISYEIVANEDARFGPGHGRCQSPITGDGSVAHSRSSRPPDEFTTWAGALS